MKTARSDVDGSHYFASLGSVFSHDVHITSHGVIFVYYSENCVFKLMYRGHGLKTSVLCGLQMLLQLRMVPTTPSKVSKVHLEQFRYSVLSPLTDV